MKSWLLGIEIPLLLLLFLYQLLLNYTDIMCTEVNENESIASRDVLINIMFCRMCST